MRLRPAALEEPGVEQEPPAGGLEQVHRAGDLARGAAEGESNGHRSHSLLLVPNSRSPASPRPGQDVPLLVELAVERGGVDGDVGVALQHPLHSLRRGDEAEEPDLPRPRLAQRGDRGHGRAAGGEHRVEHEEIALHLGRRDLEVVVHRPERVVVAVEADVAHPRRRDQLRDPLDHPEPGAEDRHQRQLLPGHLAAGRPLQRRLDLDRLGREVLGDLVGHQHRDLADQLLEVAGAGVPIAQDRELVEDQRVGENGQVGEGCLRHGSNMRGGIRRQ